MSIFEQGMVSKTEVGMARRSGNFELARKIDSVLKIEKESQSINQENK